MERRTKLSVFGLAIAGMVLASWLASPHAAHAQALVRAACSAQTYTSGEGRSLIMTTNGDLCTNATGGGGGAVTNAGTFAVQNTAALPAGTNLIGKVGIDQTTPGTTNAVVDGGQTDDVSTTNCVENSYCNARIGLQRQMLTADLSFYPYSVANAAQFTPENAGSGVQANANAIATLATAASKTTYITGFQCTSAGATAASLVTVTLANVITGTLNYVMAVPAGATVGATPLIVSFPYPVPANAVNTTIVVTMPAAGAGNTAQACDAQGLLG